MLTLSSCKNTDPDSPFMHAICAAIGDLQGLRRMWQAVSRFAVNDELIHLPAFGGSRLDERCLAEMLPILIAAAAIRSDDDEEEEEALQEYSAAGHELLRLVLDTSEALLQSRKVLQGTLDRMAGKVPSGALLLQGIFICTELVIPSVIARALQTYIMCAEVLPAQDFVVPAVCEAAKMGEAIALFQPDSVLSVTLQHAKALNLSSVGLALVICHAMAGADIGIVLLSDPSSVLKAQSELLRRISALVDESPDVEFYQEAATAICNLLQRYPSGAEQLLFPEMPKSMLKALVQTAVHQQQQEALLQLLQHSQSQKQLQCFPVNLLQAAAASPLPHSAAAIAVMEQLVSMLLQQEQRVPVAAAAFLLQQLKQASSHQQWQHLQQWLEAECRSAPPSAASQFLLRLLNLSIEGSQQQLWPDMSWQLYELLLSGQEEWGPEQQALPAAAANALIQQQGRQQADHGGAAKRVVQVWHHYSTASAAAAAGALCILRLQPAAQEKIVTALVTTGDDQHAVSLVQDVPQLLPTLAAAWQQLGKRVEVGLLDAALELAVQEGTLEAGGAAES
jgi:hypothetical protein